MTDACIRLEDIQVSDCLTFEYLLQNRTICLTLNVIAYQITFLSGDLFQQISDEGGGIPRSGLPKIWTYLYSTAKNPVVLGRQDQEMPNVMAGYGYGLPISRCYARYFGGDVQIISMEGYGKCSRFLPTLVCRCSWLPFLPYVGSMNADVVIPFLFN